MLKQLLLLLALGHVCRAFVSPVCSLAAGVLPSSVFLSSHPSKPRLAYGKVGVLLPDAIPAASRQKPRLGLSMNVVDETKFMAVQLLGTDPAPEQNASPGEGFSLIFLGPTASFEEGTGFSLKSRLDLVDGSDSQGQKRAVPVPIKPAELKLLSGLRYFESLDASRVKGRQLSILERSQAAVETKELYDALPFQDGQEGGSTDPMLRRQIVSRVTSQSGTGFKNSLDILEALWEESGCALLRVMLEEAPSIYSDDSSVTLGASVVYRDTNGVESRFSATPASAVILAMKMGAAIFIERMLWELSSSLVVDLGPPENRVLMKLDTTRGKTTWQAPQTPSQFLQRVERDRETAEMQAKASEKKIYELKASDVREMSVEQLRFVLGTAGIRSSRRDTRQDLVSLILPELDEVERRIIQIEEAVANEDYGTAASLQASQSQRGVLAALIVQAVQEERYYDAADLQQEYEILTMGRADVTQDEGSYDRFLDADDWYMRDLMKSKKKKQ